MRILSKSLLMIPLVVGCGGDEEKSDAGEEADTDTDGGSTDVNPDDDCDDGRYDCSLVCREESL